MPISELNIGNIKIHTRGAQHSKFARQEASKVNRGGLGNKLPHPIGDGSLQGENGYYSCTYRTTAQKLEASAVVKQMNIIKYLLPLTIKLHPFVFIR